MYHWCYFWPAKGIIRIKTFKKRNTTDMTIKVFFITITGVIDPFFQDTGVA